MIEENKRNNIHDELEKSSEIMQEAELLYNNGFINGAVSRLYYSSLHTVRALLLSKGLEPKSHEGTLRLLGLHFIKKGVFETKYSHIFSRLMKYREEADYNPSYMFTQEDVLELKKDVNELLDKIRGYLTEKGYL